MINFDNVDDYVVVDNFMPKKFCKEYIEKSTKLQWKKHVWTEHDKPDKFFANDEDIDVLQTHGELKEILRPYVIQAINNYQSKFQTPEMKTQAVAIGQFSTPRLNRYSKGQGIANHTDHISSLFENWQGIPVLSLVGLFNDDYKGGDFVLRDKKIDLKTGDILMFPSLFIYTHEVTPVTEGVRNSFVSWAY